jgi:Fic family protein
LNRPSVDIAVELNQAVRESDEWFEEPDDIKRLAHALSLTETAKTPLKLAASVAYRVAYSQAFTEGNKRTAFLLAVWVMDNNGLDGLNWFLISMRS